MSGVKYARGIFIYGHSLDKNGRIQSSTKRRIRRAVALQNSDTTFGSVIVAAATFAPDIPHQEIAVHRQIAEYAFSVGSYCVSEIPARTFDTNGEQDMFVAEKYRTETHITSWWHMPRVMLGRYRRGRDTGVSVNYVPIWDIPTPRCFALECAKLCTFLLPATWQESVRVWVKKRIRTSW